MLLAQLATSRDNNFNLIRFIAATLVLVSHSYPLAMGKGYHEPLHTLGLSWGSVAVDVFFVASGFFIAASLSLKSSLKSFVAARILRINPALIVTTLLSVFILGVIFTRLTTSEYLSNAQTYKHLLKNITLISGIEYNLPGVFIDNPYKEAVNGSLWTLPYEIKMYFFLVIFYYFFSHINKKIKPQASINTILFLLLTVAALFSHIANHFYGFYAGQSLKLFTMFFMGSSFYFLRNKISINSKIGIPALTLLALSTLHIELFFIAYTLLLAYIVFYLAYIPKGHIRKFNNTGDYSYGIYIYAFPVQQIVAACFPGISILGMIATSFLGTFVMAYMSWHIIEDKCLRLKRFFT
jgi:peptidoglycan/LPS O-acetylase OafA/YrhL